MKLIPFLRPNLVKKEAYLDYLAQIDASRLYSNYGPLNTQFESRVLAEYFGGEGGVTTVNNCTTGLILAISRHRRPRGRYALMPSFTFAATPLAAQWCGLEPYFIDVRPDTWSLDEEKLGQALGRLGDEVAVVVPYAAFGHCLDLAYYRGLESVGVPVVLDAAPGFGTFSNDGHFGRGFPGMVVFSFHATKAFGIGEGGLVYSGRMELIDEIRQAANFGFSNNRESLLLGLNSKLTEIGAAIALATLDAFAGKVEIRQQIYAEYQRQMDRAGMFTSGWVIQDSAGRIPHQFVPLACPNGQLNGVFLERLAGRGIEARSYFSPSCHQQYQFRGLGSGDLAVTEALSRRILSLPLWEGMGTDDIVAIVEGLIR